MNSCHEQELTANIPRTLAAPAINVRRLSSSLLGFLIDEFSRSAEGLFLGEEPDSDDFLCLIVANLNAWLELRPESKVS